MGQKFHQQFYNYRQKDSSKSQGKSLHPVFMDHNPARIALSLVAILEADQNPQKMM